MKTYMVGGAVRDTVLGKKPSDIDYVVVGATPEEMFKLGFEQVGADFPVFLHPETKDEYALARTEKKTGKGYLDFETEFSPNVTLEDDLLRRDLTINAMAMDENGNIVDPYNGLKDIKEKKLRHVSEAFKDDPLRILRVARFCAKMPDFTIAEETLNMLKEMVKNGEANNLKKERIWKEIEKGFLSSKPSKFIEALDQIGVLGLILPDIKKMQNIPQRDDYHAEGDVYVHTLMVLDEASELSKDLPDEDKMLVRMSALLHDIGKAYTPESLLYHEDGSVKGNHFGHDGLEIVKEKIEVLAKNICMPTNIKVFCIDAAYVHQRVHGIKAMSPSGITRMFNELAIRQKSENGKEMRYVNNLLMTCHADSLGRRLKVNNIITLPEKDYPQKDLFIKYFNEYYNYSNELQDWIKKYKERNDKQPDGLSIKAQVNQIRVSKIKKVKPQ